MVFENVKASAHLLLKELGISSPPLDADICLDSRGIQVDTTHLTDYLSINSANITVPTQSKLDAMFDVQERRVWFKEGLHQHQRKFGKLHEVGHDFMPWQHDVLYFCSFFDLPKHIQKEWEKEANVFAAECMFLGGQFIDDAFRRPFGLKTAMQLAEIYEASYESAFRYYVTNHHRPCTLLVSDKAESESGLLIPGPPKKFKIRYYVNSPSFIGKISANQQFTNHEISKLFTLETLDDVINHELIANGPDGQIVFHAQSFQNSYKVFSLLSTEAFD